MKYLQVRKTAELRIDSITEKTNEKASSISLRERWEVHKCEGELLKRRGGRRRKRAN